MRGRTWLGRELLTWLLWRSESTNAVTSYNDADLSVLFVNRITLRGLHGELTELLGEGNPGALLRGGAARTRPRAPRPLGPAAADRGRAHLGGGARRRAPRSARGEAAGVADAKRKTTACWRGSTSPISSRRWWTPS